MQKAFYNLLTLAFFILLTLSSVQATSFLKDAEDIFSQKSSSGVRESKKRKAESPIPKEERKSFKHFNETIKSFQAQVEQAYKQADMRQLYNVYVAFTGLDYNLEFWKKLGRNFQDFKWPSQKTDKEVIGGHLFFPSSHIHQWQETSYTEHLLQRSDIIRGLVFATQFGHSLAKFYLVQVLTGNTGGQESILPFCTKLLEEAMFELNSCLDCPDVCYAIGKAHGIYPYTSRNYNSLSSLELHEKGGDLRNQFEALNLKSRLVEYKEKPAVEDYMVLARQGYGPAYLKAVELAEKKDQQQSKAIIDEAVSDGYTPALIYLSDWYEKQGDLEHSLSCLEQAGMKGLAYGFKYYGIELVGAVKDSFSDQEWEKFRHTSSEQRLKAAKYFKRTGKAKDPEGYEYLASLYLKLAYITPIKEEKKSYKQDVLKALLKGCHLGSKTCYFTLSLYFKKKYTWAIKHIGPDPQNVLETAVEQFLTKKTQI